MKITPRTLISPPKTPLEFIVSSVIYESAWLATYYGLGSLLAPPTFAGHNLGPQQTYQTFRKQIYTGAGLVLRGVAPAVPFAAIVGAAAYAGSETAKEGITSTPFSAQYFTYNP